MSRPQLPRSSTEHAQQGREDGEMNSYHVFYSYVVRDRMGGKAINSSAGTNSTIRAKSHAGMVLALVRRLQKFHGGVVSELKLIKVG